MKFLFFRVNNCSHFIQDAWAKIRVNTPQFSRLIGHIRWSANGQNVRDHDRITVEIWSILQCTSLGSNSITSTCCGFVVQQIIQQLYTTDWQQIEV